MVSSYLKMMSNLCGRVANFEWNIRVEKLNSKICLVVWCCVKEAIDLVITRGGKIFVQPDPITRSSIREHILYGRIQIWILILFGFRTSHGFYIFGLVTARPNKYKNKIKIKKEEA